jgi:hypothetical protein
MGMEQKWKRAPAGKEGLERVDDRRTGPNATSLCEKKVTQQPVITPRTNSPILS